MEKKQTAMKLVYDKIAPYLTNGKELLAVDVLTVIQEIGMPSEREQIEEAFQDGWMQGDYVSINKSEYYEETFKP